MDPEIPILIMLASLADIRTALWALVTVEGMVVAAILAHALLTRRRS